MILLIKIKLNCHKYTKKKQKVIDIYKYLLKKCYFYNYFL